MRIRKRHSLLLGLVAGLALAGPWSEGRVTESPRQEPPWRWPESRVLEIARRVRAGRDLTPRQWPAGARVAVGLSFDFDNETPALRDGQTSPALMAQGEYGARAGLPRILRLLDEYQIPATFFIPAMSAKLYPQSVREILARGRHEIGLHGWIHERNSLLSEQEERELMRRSLDALEQITGRRPVGIRTPSWDLSPATMKLIREFGLLYDSSLMADDRPYEIVLEGAPTGVVELPVEWILDDYPYFGMDRQSAIRPHTTPEEVFSIWRAEFDQAYEEGTLFILTLHPHIIGHRSRIVMLERLIRHMRQRPGVWFATHEEIARYVREMSKHSTR
ncbi:Peptidoglycan deacetylase [bacterium HR10]|nr:Peptidoglycan deacetylase [bacterium HR10]